MAKNVFSEVMVTLTFDLLILISLSMSPSERLFQICRNQPQALPRYRVQQNGTDGRTDGRTIATLSPQLEQHNSPAVAHPAPVQAARAGGLSFLLWSPFPSWKPQLDEERRGGRSTSHAVHPPAGLLCSTFSLQLSGTFSF